MNFKNKALELQEKLTTYRRDFHAHPELSGNEVRTSGIIRQFLIDNNIEIQEIGAKNCVVGIIRGKYPGKTFALRADIDALPIYEADRDLPYCSQNDGVMHACGHDAHTSCLMGAALLLNDIKDSIHGNVKLFFQASEEAAPSGAEDMVAHGCMENPHVDAVFAYHVNNSIPAGQVAFWPGARNASVDTYDFKIKGKGGHGAYPHRTIDPIVTAAYFITSLQSIVSRNVDPTLGGVLTIGYIHGGTVTNVIPEEVTLGATVRALDNRSGQVINTRIPQIVKATEEMYNCTIETIHRAGNNVVYNDPEFTAKYPTISAAKIVGEENIYKMDAPSMGGDDFAAMLDASVGTYGDLGTMNAEKGATAGTHTPYFNLDEDALWIGAATFAQIAFDYLEDNK